MENGAKKARLKRTN